MRDTGKKFRLALTIKILVFSIFFSIIFTSCNDSHLDVSQKEMVDKPEQINARAEDVIQGTLKDILNKSKRPADSFHISNPEILQYLYEQNSFQPLWSSSGLFTPNGDSLFAFLGAARYYGLFP